jgi:hypothetical protein
MYQKLKENIVNIPYFNWITITPLFLAFLLPNILEPEWMWRLGLIFTSCLGLFLLALRGVVFPGVLKNDLTRVDPKSRKVIFAVCYVGLLIGLIALSIFIYKSGSDILSYKNLETKQVFIDKTETGGATVLIGQRIFFEGKSHYLAFHWGLIMPQQEHVVTYSPVTGFVYSIKPIAE